MHKFPLLLAFIASGILLTACSQAGPTESTSASTAKAQVADPGLPKMVAYRSPTCGCCELWVEHMRAAGFDVTVETRDDVHTVKVEAGVPPGGGSCHTALVAGYFVEGHVPASDVRRLLETKPDALGLTVPGMVVGSPGMEQGGAGRPYDVLLVARDGTTSVFSHHEP